MDGEIAGLAAGRCLGEVHAAEEGLEAGVRAEGVKRKECVLVRAQMFTLVPCHLEPLEGPIDVAESHATDRQMLIGVE